ncbi:DUF4252 domain-containing protein [Antarcticibacterium flavum]|uniref:DUF4252 domain-containing protein n=1 Tax=Antarcticibacterium flavum TaxID=2058175 RepID=A0A5B7X9D9_9FLAO|nr:MULTISPECIES: DUF4252 domain-containing protein [Antarcticibacterium]MCM4160359.1 DUF4252 domain-containing protein [Antarcticibacterium sp. W02-3]QCY71263.1 DUF4252 domain-containing protein [Antarcticibacterium flavum]
MKWIKTLSVVCLGIMMTACNNEQSLQQYYVENQSNKDFVAIDVPTSLFTNSESLNADQKRTLETIKKINVLAIPQKTENKLRIEEEKANVNNILKDEKYQLLMRLGGGESRIEIYFTGEEEAIDELILYGFDENRGMGIARVLGDNMNPGDIINLMKSLEKGDLDLNGLSGIAQMFTDGGSTPQEAE